MKRVVIIGAGIAGLTAARELARGGGVEVTVVESSDRPGGLAITLEHEGRRVDLGPHRLHTELPEAQAVFDETPGDQLVETVRRSRMMLEGQLFRYPPSIVEMGARMPLRSAGFATSLLASKLSPEGDHETFADALRGVYGRRLYDYFFAPYAAKVWKTDPETISADIVASRISSGKGGLLSALRPRSVSRVHYLRGGIEALPRRLADEATKAGARLMTRTRAVEFEGDANAARAVLCLSPTGPTRLGADVVLSTAPLPNLVELLAPLRDDADAQTAADGLEFLRLILVNLLIDRDRATPDHWLYFPQEGTSVNRAHEPKNFSDDMAPDGCSLLSGEITCRGDDDLWTSNDAALVDSTQRALCAQGIVDPGSLSGAFVHRLERAYPLYTLDYRARLDRVLDYTIGFSNLVIFGRQGLFCHNNMDHSIVMGLRAASAARDKCPGAAMRDNQEEFRRFRIVD